MYIRIEFKSDFAPELRKRISDEMKDDPYIKEMVSCWSVGYHDNGTVRVEVNTVDPLAGLPIPRYPSSWVQSLFCTERKVEE